MEYIAELNQLQKLENELDACRFGMVQCDLSTDDGLRQFRLLQKIEASIKKDIENEQI